MEEWNFEEFRKNFESHIRKFTLRKSGKYIPYLRDYNMGSLKESKEELVFLLKNNFKNKEEKFFKVYKKEGQEAYVSYLAIAVENGLREIIKQQDPLHSNLVRNTRKGLKELSEEGHIEIHYEGRGKSKTIVRSRTLKKNRDSESVNEVSLIQSNSNDPNDLKITRCQPYSTLPELLAVLNQIDYNLISEVAKEYKEVAKENKKEKIYIYIKGKKIKEVLTVIHARLDSWITTKDFCDALKRHHPLLKGFEFFSINEGEYTDQDEGGIKPPIIPPVIPSVEADSKNCDKIRKMAFRLRECLSSLTPRQQRIYELRRGNRRSYKEISKILKQENFGLDQSGVQKQWKKIEKIIRADLQKDRNDGLNPK